jgi:hypothetical protein
VLAPLRSGMRERIMSPSGASILMTSAPRSASSRVQRGPAIVVVKSSTLRPEGSGHCLFLVTEATSNGAARTYLKIV